MAHPKRKTSKSTKNERRSHLALRPVEFGQCPSCGATKRPHRVCATCGYYGEDRSVAV